MKNQTILNVLIIALGLGLMAFFYTKNDKPAYEPIFRQDAQHQRSNHVMSGICEHLVRSMEGEVRELPQLKPLVDFSRNIYQIKKEVTTELDQTKAAFFVMPEVDYSEVEGFIFPNDYNKHQPVKIAFREKAHRLAQTWEDNQNKWQALIDGLQSPYSDKKKSDFETLKANLQQVLDQASQEGFLTEEQMLKQIKHLDVAHTSIYISITEQHLLNALYETLSLCLHFIKNQANLYDFDNYQIVMSQEKMAKVGEPFRADFFMAAYLDNLETTMRINGREIPVKDGIGYYKYTPTTAGEKAFRADIAIKNPYTGKMDNFSKTFKTEVID